MRFLVLLSFLLSTFYSRAQSPDEFVSVNGKYFSLNGKPYYYLGANYWYGMNLGSKGPGGDRARLKRELDYLKSIGVTNLRVMAGTEGPNDEPYRIVPALQTSPGKYDQDLLEGLDFLLDEMGKRDMKAVMCMNNFWHWSGGMGQYLVWNGEDSIPYPPPHPGGSWTTYQKFTAKFYDNKGAMKDFEKHLKFIIKRKNSINKKSYINDPTIMTWELGNEPRGVNNRKGYLSWIEKTTALIKKMDQNHLVTLGSEGYTAFRGPSGMDFKVDHDFKNVDYTCIHIWIENFTWYNPTNSKGTYDKAFKKALAYLEEQNKEAEELNKPMVLEEFGIARDNRNYDPDSTVIDRNRYYNSIFEVIYQYAKRGTSVAGANFWAYGGEGRPKMPFGSFWKAGDDFIGDPPHEKQGWYSIYDKDKTTLSVIEEYAKKMISLSKQ